MNSTASENWSSSSAVQKSPRAARPAVAAELVGLDAGGVLERLGQPEIARYESKVGYWRYADGGCILDVYLVEDESTRRVSVAHISLRPRAGFVNDPRCRKTDHAQPARSKGLPPVAEH